MTKTVTIQGVAIDISQPYIAGHPITEAEAKALNQTRSENIGNNMRTKIKALLDVEGATSETVQGDAQGLVATYDAAYIFSMASVGGGRAPADPVEREAQKIARAYIAGKLKDAGVSQKAYKEANGEDAIALKVAELAEKPEVIKAAKEAIKAREKQADGIGEGFSLNAVA
jgi:hypothetical protein